MARKIKLVLPNDNALNETTRPYFDWTVSPPSPTNIRILSSEVNAEAASAVIEWDVVIDATSYGVPSYNVYRAEQSIGNTSEPSYNFVNLLPNVVEHLGVSAINYDGESVISCFDLYLEIGEYDDDIPFAAPTNLRVETNETEMFLLWDAPVAGLESVTSYFVEKQISENAFGRLGETSETSYLLSDLQSNTTYVFQVSAIYPSGVSLPVTMSYTTGDLGEAKVENFRIVQINPDVASVDLAWDEVVGAIEYELTIAEFNNTQVVVAPAVTHTLVLSMGQRFAVSIVAKLDETTKTPASKLTVAMPYAPVQNFQATDIMATSFKLTWEQEPGLSYRLWDTLSTYTEVINSNTKSFSNLTPGWTYSFRIVAFKDNLESYQATELEVADTLLEEPLAEIKPMIREIYDTSVLVAWNLVGAKKYKVYMDDAFVAEVGALDFYHFTGLVSKTRHKFGVQAIRGTVESPVYSVYACTMPLIWAENVTQTGFDVVFQQYTPQPNMYYQTMVNFQKVNTLRDESGNDLRIKHDGVENMESYFVEVFPTSDSIGDKAITTAIGQTLASSISVIVNTLPYTLSPAMVGTIGSTEATISFLQLPPEQYKRYEVFLNDIKVAEIKPGEPAKYTFTGLTPSTLYDFGVRYVKISNVNSEREVVSGTTAA